MQPPDVDKAEQKQIEGKGFTNFLVPDDQTGIRWVRRKKDDICWFLTNDNQCAIYEVRPAICKLEPFTLVDYDYEKKTIHLELNFPFLLCCQGMSDKEIVPVEVIGKAAQALVQKILKLTAQDMGLATTDKRVHREMRSRLLRRVVEMADLQL